jgi:hypothetical protein
VDKIKDERSYLWEKFSCLNRSNKTDDKGPKQKGGAGIAIGIFFLASSILGMVFSGRAGDASDVIGVYVSLFFMGVFCFIIGKAQLKKGKAASTKTDPSAFHLVSPYAVKAEYGERAKKGDWEATDSALRVYYMDGSTRREAVTEGKYSGAEVHLLETAFRKGTLIVACAKTAGATVDFAFICER